MYKCVYCNLGPTNLVMLLFAGHIDEIIVRQSGYPFQQNFGCRLYRRMLELLVEELGHSAQPLHFTDEAWRGCSLSGQIAN